MKNNTRVDFINKDSKKEIESSRKKNQEIKENSQVEINKIDKKEIRCSLDVK